MDPNIVSTGLSVIGSLANSVIGSSVNANLNAKNRRWQEQMAATQYQRQRDLTQDTPLLQKQGIVNAGMSPSAMGSFSGPASSVSSVPSSPSSLPEYVPMDMNSIIQAYTAAKQGEVADSEVYKNKTQGDKNAKEAGRYDELTDSTIKEIQSRVGLNEEQTKNLAASIPLLNNQSEYYQWLSKQQQLTAQRSSETYDSDIERIKAENKCSTKEAEKRLELADDIIEAQLNLTYAQIYNARASGQAQLSNATTNRLQYKLDSALNTYLQEYYKEGANKLRAEGDTEDSLRGRKWLMLNNDAAVKGAQARHQNLDNEYYLVDKTVDAGTKLLGSAVGAYTSIKNAKSGRINANANEQRSMVPQSKRVDIYHHRKR